MKKMRKLQANAKIVLGLVQVLQLCQGTFRIEVPAPFSELSKVFRFVTLDFVSLVNLHCLVSYNWISLFVARCTMPWVFVGAIRLIGRKHVTSSEKSAWLLAAFEAADEDGSGCLDSRELRTAIAELRLVRVRLRLLLYSLRPESLSLPVGTIQVGIFRA